MEEVTEEEGKELSEKIGAVFGITSALRGIGIEELFKNIGNKLLDLNNEVVEIEHPKEIDGFYLVETFKLEDYKEQHHQKKKKDAAIINNKI